MAGVQSPSDAFTHLQHHQHNDLLGPSMQVRGPRTSLTSSTTHCNPCQCIVVPLFPANPIPYFPIIHKTVWAVGIAWLSCLFNHFGMGCIAHRAVQIAFTLQSLYSQCQSFTFFKKLSEACVFIFVNMQHFQHVACQLCLHFILVTSHSHKNNV